MDRLIIISVKKGEIAIMNQEIRKAITMLNIEDIKTEQITNIGEGAWHDVYRIKMQDREDLVIRIRKKVSYGQLQKYDEIDLITEYESSRLYYQQANKTSFNICPVVFHYHVEESLIFTVESFMGESKKIQSLSHLDAFKIGETLGGFLKDMHNIPPDIKGFGNIVWNGKHLEGSVKQAITLIWKNDNDFYLTILNELVASNLIFNRIQVREKILRIINNRRKHLQKVALVNRDVTPENIVFDTNQTALIDPFPKLDFDLKYAGYFIFCYKFLLPSYANTNRYQRYFYDRYSEVMNKIADGFMNGYTDSNKNLSKKLLEEYVLWILSETYEHYKILNERELDSKTLQQMGDKGMIKDRLLLYLRELEKA